MTGLSGTVPIDHEGRAEMALLEWSPITEADLDQLKALASICLERDGGLPSLASEETLRAFFYSGEAIGGRDETGDLVAVAGLFRSEGRVTASGLVHPASRGEGHGEALVAWAREHANGVPLRVVAETTSPESNTLYATSGLTRSFAETVMVHSLRGIPRIARPQGVQTAAFTEETAGAFHAAYRSSFGDRPGFPDTPQDEWLSWLIAGDNFRPADSRVAFDAAGEPVGFVTVSDGWIDQVGVSPRWRGRSLGAHLVVRSLSALRRAGSEQVWLCVNVDNPARSLYERLGFVARGTRARYLDRIVTRPS